jgi:hypothetical protein
MRELACKRTRFQGHRERGDNKGLCSRHVHRSQFQPPAPCVSRHLLRADIAFLTRAVVPNHLDAL